MTEMVDYIYLHESWLGNSYACDGWIIEALLQRGQLCLDMKEET